MSVLDNLKDGISTIEATISQNPLASVAVATGGGVAVGATVGSIVATKVAKRKKKSKKSKKKSSKSRKGKRKLKFGSKAYRKKYLHKGHKHKRNHKQRQPHTAGKRKDRSHKRIRFTKNNQPYIILANGRARFIKRSSVSRSRKMKGGRY